MTSPGTTALIVAAGQGSRMNGDLPKQYRALAGKSVLRHAIDAFLTHPGIDLVQVVIGQGQDALYHAAIGDCVLPPPVIGGESRRESVRAGLAVIGTEQVLIHDAARPLVPAATIDRLLYALSIDAGAVPVLSVVDSLAQGEVALGEPVDRSGLVRVQTPQAFHTAAIIAAHDAWPAGEDATDDAQVLRRAGGRVATVAGDSALDKLTYQADFDVAASKLSHQMTSRTGMGFDVHAFGGEGPVWLGGIAIAHPQGLAGHSDADVALHALTDALLGAAALGDIGDHFPPSDPQWKGAPSRLFLEHAAQLIRSRGGIIDHVDLTIICEAPRIGPHRESMRDCIASLLRLGRGRISVKATTTERLGFTGRAEGIAAQAVATIRMKEES